jgi:hypothetical protein
MLATSGAVVGAPKLILRFGKGGAGIWRRLFLCATTARGHGLKYAMAFDDTHLGYIGR